MDIRFFKPTFPLRKNLVIIRAGDQSIHKQWRRDIQSSERSWDIAVSYFGESVHYERDYEEFVFFQKSFKYDAIFDLVKNIDVISSYESIWMPDDDIDCSWNDINQMFSAFKEYKLDLSQPSLTKDSFYSHEITVNDGRYDVRYVNFVEVMAPVFSINALRQCLPSFSGSRTGWGLDFVWPCLLGNQKTNMGIIDRISVKHTRAVGGGDIYNSAKAKGITSPEEEMRMTLNKFGVTRPDMRIYGVIFK